MSGAWRTRVPGFARSVVLVTATLALATAAVSVLESAVGVPNASTVYLVAVVVCGVASGTWSAAAAAIGSFLVYNYAFTEPRYTLAISDPGVLLSVVLLLFVGIVVGRLAAMQRARADVAVAREREARAVAGVSRVLATRESTPRSSGTSSQARRRTRSVHIPISSRHSTMPRSRTSYTSRTSRQVILGCYRSFEARYASSNTFLPRSIHHRGP